MKHLRVFKVKFLGPTNYRGDRVKIIDGRFKKSVTIPYSYEFNDALGNAVDYLEKLGFSLNGFNATSSEDYYYLMTDDFETQIK